MRPELPEIFGQIIDRALKKHPTGRYATGLDMAGDLDLIHDHIQVTDYDRSGREKFEKVAKLPFSVTVEPEIWEIINASLWQDFTEHEEIISEGEDVSSIFVLVFGSVRCASAVNVDRLSAGACFGELSYISKRGRTAVVAAEERRS